MLRPTFLALVLALLVALPARAQDYQKAQDAIGRGDYATALKDLKPLAERGNVKAQYVLGNIYEIGLGGGLRGTTQDWPQAIKWFRKAADQGHVRAQYRLGNMYDIGKGTPKDYVNSAKWYRKAADQGHAKALNRIAGMYLNGRGVPKDYVLAYMWWNISAALGHSRSADNRGRMVKLMTPAQIAEAQKLAREWRAKHPKKK